MRKKHKSDCFSITGTVTNFIPGLVTNAAVIAIGYDIVSGAAPEFAGFSSTGLILGGVVGGLFSIGARIADLVTYTNHQKQTRDLENDEEIPLAQHTIKQMPNALLYPILACDWIDESSALIAPMLSVIFDETITGLAISRLTKGIIFIFANGLGIAMAYADVRTSKHNLKTKAKDVSTEEEKADAWTLLSMGASISAIIGVSAWTKNFIETLFKLPAQNIAKSLPLSLSSIGFGIMIAIGSTYTLYKINYNHQDQSFAINELPSSLPNLEAKPRQTCFKNTSKRTAATSYWFDIASNKALLMNKFMAIFNKSYSAAVASQFATLLVSFFSAYADYRTGHENLEIDSIKCCSSPVNR